jgi:hypothetical protein
MRTIFLSILLCLLTVSAWGANGTFYVCDTGTACNASSSGWVTGNDSSACTSKGAACKSIRGAIGKMSGTGNTITIGDGIYQGANNMLSGSATYYTITNGAAGAYNKFVAEHYLGAVIDGQTTSTTIWVDGNYLWFEGLYLKNSYYSNFREEGNYNVVVKDRKSVV